MLPVPVNSQFYGFSSLATYQGTYTTINVAGGAKLRINGSGVSNYNGILVISSVGVGSGEVEIASASPGIDTTGNGIIDMRNRHAYAHAALSAANASKLLPQSTGFTLKFNNCTFIGNVDGSINGNLIINDEASGAPVSP